MHPSSFSESDPSLRLPSLPIHTYIHDPDNGGYYIECKDYYCDKSFVAEGNCDAAKYRDKEPFGFGPYDMRLDAQCFAASNPNPAGGSTSAGQLAGPTGVFCAR